MSGQPPGILHNTKMGTGRTPQPLRNRRKSEKISTDVGAGLHNFSTSKNKLPMAMGQDADIGICQRQTAEVAAVLVK